LGLVTLYSGYAELEIDALLDSLVRVAKLSDKALNWPVGQKIAKARDIVNGINAEALSELVKKLDEATILFDRRNALVHGAIFGSIEVVVSRATGREQPVSPDALTSLAQPVSPDALTSLANEIFTVKEHINANRQRVLEPILASIGQEDGT
jgi:hypothetical protein